MKKLAQKILLCFLFYLLWNSQAIAQKEGNIWCFGDHAAIDFNSGTPVTINGSILFTYDNSSTVCDTAGNLLFYTNGENVWNKNNVVMNNGNNLGGSTTGGQAAVIIRQPFSNDIYYIFTADAFGASGGLKYSIVDITQYSGLGSVIQKGIVLQNPSTEKLCAYYNCIEKIAWLISHQANSNKFYCYKLNALGLDTNPVITAIGPNHNSSGWGVVNNTAGQMSISKAGTKLAAAKYLAGTIGIYDFDPVTGVVSNGKNITGFNHAWGLEFSPDGTKLYASKWYSTDEIIQYDLSSNNITQIINSATVIGNATSSNTGPYNAGYLQRGPDDKIYVARWNENFIGVINQPDSIGVNCNYVNDGVALTTGQCKAGLSRVLVSECIPNSISEIHPDKTIQIFPLPASTYIHIKIDHQIIQSFSLFNSVGQKVIELTGIDSFEFEIDISNLPNGIYNLVINDIRTGVSKTTISIVH